MRKQDNNKDTFRIARIYLEFPWLSRHINRNWVKTARVSRLDRDAINRFPNNLTDSYEEIILLIDENGKLVSRVGYKPTPIFRGLGFYILVGKENIADTSIRIGVNETRKVKFAMAFDYDGGHLIVYKLPNPHATLADLIKEIVQIADNAVNQQLKEAEKVKL